MFKHVLNEISLVFDLEPYEGPLLIKSGRESGADPTLPDMNFVRSLHPRTGEMTVFLPGSSLKGTLRSYCEKIARTVRPEYIGPEWCCDPFDSRSSCSHRLERETLAAIRYARSCVACRTFGHTGLGSHVSLTDAYPLGEPKLEQRDGVAIDRMYGAAANPFNMEVVTQGVFRCTLTLRNFQLWQVGLLTLGLRDIGRGQVPIGFGKSKGFGRVRVTYQQLEISYPGRFAPEANGHNFTSELMDLAGFDFPNKASYALLSAAPPSLSLPGEGRELIENGTFGRVAVRWTDSKTIAGILYTTIGHWRACATEPWPPRSVGDLDAE